MKKLILVVLLLSLAVAAIAAPAEVHLLVDGEKAEHKKIVVGQSVSLELIGVPEGWKCGWTFLNSSHGDFAKLDSKDNTVVIHAVKEGTVSVEGYAWNEKGEYAVASFFLMIESATHPAHQ